MDDIEHMDLMVRDASDTHGPWSYSEVEFKVRMKEIPDSCEYRTIFDTDWKPISDLKKQMNYNERDELRALSFRKTDGVFLLGLFLFFASALLYFIDQYLGILLLIISLIMEVAPIVYSIKNEPKAINKMIGNILALCWSAFQFIITIGFIAFTFS
ncbi:MAG: hypothetical protein QCI82_04790 [Candidatus Thermoplasmatota archaeon]|nr:hypothetical protein [Candidatus Thermoplasmatota archaeon]